MTTPKIDIDDQNRRPGKDKDNLFDPNISPVPFKKSLIKLCPLYLNKEIVTTEQDTYIEDGQPITNNATTTTVYERMGCNETCGLYEFRPRCIIKRLGV